MNASNKWVSVSTPYLMPRREGQVDAWTEDAAGQGGTGAQRLREAAEVVPPPDVTAALKIPAGEVAIVRRRIMLLDGQPVELTDSYYPAAIARGTGLAEPRKIPGGATTLLTELGYRPHDAEEDVSARAPSADERRLLALEHDEWVLVLSRLVRDSSGLPVEVSVMTMIARNRHLRYRLSL
jgi:DNA-binding GntR family transcriptional regulator